MFQIEASTSVAKAVTRLVLTSRGATCHIDTFAETKYALSKGSQSRPRWEWSLTNVGGEQTPTCGRGNAISGLVTEGAGIRGTDL